SAGLAGWVEAAMELASGTLVSSKDRRDPSYAISHQPGNAGQTRVATRGKVPTRGIRVRIVPLRGRRSLVLGRVPEENLRAAVGSDRARGQRLAVRREADRTHFPCMSFECHSSHWHPPSRPTPRASRPTPHAAPAGSGRAQTLPRRLLPDTDRPIAKKPNGPDLEERPLYSSMSPNQP